MRVPGGLDLLSATGQHDQRGNRYGFHGISPMRISASA
jgi:hypothetical protein